MPPLGRHDNVAVRVRAGRCLVASVAPPFRTAYWPSLQPLVAELGLPAEAATDLDEAEAKSRLLSALADRGPSWAAFRPRRIGFSLGPEEIRARERLREARRSVTFLGRCPREVIFGALETVTAGLARGAVVEVRFDEWDALADWDRGRECIDDACGFLVRTRDCGCTMRVRSEFEAVPPGLWEFVYERPRVRIDWVAAGLAGFSGMHEFEEWRKGSIAFGNLEKLGNEGLWPQILLPASATNVRLLPELTLALVEATRGATVEVVPAPLASRSGASAARAVDKAADSGPFQRRGWLQAPGVEDYVEALLTIYGDRRIPLRLVSPLSWVAARVNSEAPMVSSLVAAGAEVAVLPDGSLYAGEQAAGLEDWRLGNVLESAREIRWERLDAMPETFASSVKPERCLSCDWRWRCGGVDAAVMLLEEKQKAESGKQKAGGGVDASVPLLEAAAGQGPAGNGTGGAPAAVLEDAGRMPAPLFDLYCAPRKRLFEEMLWGSAEAAARQQPRPGRERIELREDGIDFAPVNNTQKHRI